MMTSTRYVTTLFVFIIALLALVASFNYVVNPYLIFSDKRINGLNQYKADINKFVRQAKAYQPISLPIHTLLVGNSRVEMGLNPQHRCLPENTYNLGLPGAGVELQVAYALNLVRMKPEINRIIMSLDFTDFTNRKPGGVRTEFSYSGQSRLYSKVDGQPNDRYWFATLKDRYMALLSLDATISSVKTLLGQKPSASDRHINGFNPANDVAEATRVEGPFQIFNQTRRMLEGKLSNQYYESVKGLNNADFKALALLNEQAQQSNIELIYFINPLHQSFFEVIDSADLSDGYQQWLQDVHEFLKPYPHIAFHDFNQMPGFTDEPYPEKKQRQSLTWFWEPAHYKSELGDILLDNMLAHACPGKE